MEDGSIIFFPQRQRKSLFSNDYHWMYLTESPTTGYYSLEDAFAVLDKLSKRERAFTIKDQTYIDYE